MFRHISKWIVVATAALLFGAVACSNEKLQCKKNADCATGYVCTYGACFKSSAATGGVVGDQGNGQ